MHNCYNASIKIDDRQCEVIKRLHSRRSIVAHEYLSCFTPTCRTVGKGTSNVGCSGPDYLHINYIEHNLYAIININYIYIYKEGLHNNLQPIIEIKCTKQ